MDIESWFVKQHKFFGLDIGQSSIKVVELKSNGSNFEVTHIFCVKASSHLFSNQNLNNSDAFTDTLSEVQDKFDFFNKKAVIGIPGPSVFTKRIKIPRPADGNVLSAVQYEADSVIPSGINGVKLDYHILKSSTEENLDILLVAVRNEIIDSYLETITSAGLNVGIADVDFFALQNCFELNYPEYYDSLVALIDVGHRFCSIIICKQGESLAMGDVSINPNEPENIAIEINRTLKFLWSSLSSDEKIKKIFLAGGNSAFENMSQLIATKTAIECEIINPFKEIALPSSLESQVFEPKAQFAIALGLACRKFNDRVENVEI